MSAQTPILLVYPPCTGAGHPPLPLATAAGFLAAQGARISCYDADLEFQRGLLSASAPGSDSGAAPPLTILSADSFYEPACYLDATAQSARLCGAEGSPEFQEAVQELCATGLVPLLTGAEPVRPVLLVADPTQRSAAGLVARFLEENFPGIPVAVAECDPTGGRLREALPGLLAAPGDPSRALEDAAPAFDHLPVGRYLAPAVVLPADLARIPGSGEGWAAQVTSRLHALVEAWGAEGFLAHRHPIDAERLGALLGAADGAPPPFSLAVQCALDTASPLAALTPPEQSPVRLVAWRVGDASAEAVRKLLWRFSRADVWNHLVLGDDSDPATRADLAHFAVENPNIVHSWAQPPLPGVFPEPHQGLTAGPYGALAPLPSTPFHNRLRDPAHLLVYLRRHGAHWVGQRRVQEDGRVSVLGQSLEYSFSAPDDLPPGYLDEIVRLVEAGGSVAVHLVRYNLERAFLIGYAMEGGVIVGDSSLKHPRPEYLQHVSHQAGIDLSDALERGYTSVRPEYRGLGVGTKLLEGLTARAAGRKIYSIIAEDNEATKKIAVRNRTRQIASFHSEVMGKQVGIWMPEDMIDRR